MYSFRDDSISDLFVHHHTDGARVNVEDSTYPPMVLFIWHTFIYSSIGYNINNISNIVGGECFRDMHGTMLFKSFFKFMSRSSLVTVAVRYDDK